MPPRGRSFAGWTALTGLLLALILVPFFLWHDRLDSWTSSLLDVRSSPAAVAFAVIALLGSDIFLPIPSSLVSTAAGALLGAAIGAVASTAGMTIACILGYAAGRWFGEPLARRIVSEASLARAGVFFQKWGVWALVLMRPVPVLAEASVVLGGLGRLDASRFLLATFTANLGISLVYALVGSTASGLVSFLLAFAAAILLPGIAMMLFRRATRPS